MPVKYTLKNKNQTNNERFFLEKNDWEGLNDNSDIDAYTDEGVVSLIR